VTILKDVATELIPGAKNTNFETFLPKKTKGVLGPGTFEKTMDIFSA
jgi:hypothetical protein